MFESPWSSKFYQGVHIQVNILSLVGVSWPVNSRTNLGGSVGALRKEMLDDFYLLVNDGSSFRKVKCVEVLEATHENTKEVLSSRRLYRWIY